MSHPVGAIGAHQIDTGSNWCQSEATQQKFEGIPSLGAIHWLLAHLCDGARSQGIVRVRIAEVYRTKQTKIVKGGFCTIWAYKGKKSPILELHNSVYPRFYPEPDFSRAGPPGVGRMGMWISCEGEVPVILEESGAWIDSLLIFTARSYMGFGALGLGNPTLLRGKNCS